MKRVEEKVKDIVEVRSFANLVDLSGDSAATLAGYRFTDITADLMAKWLDAVGSVKPGAGAALALAGFRGVGKSHFLSTLHAIISQTALREQISDPHVASAAARLPRRGVSVLVVRRGLRPSLIEEIKDAVASQPGSSAAPPTDSLRELMTLAAGENALVVLVDTSMEREARVSRDDGAVLGELAQIAVSQGIFLGIALDDDIAGADGPNLAISGSFKIDYLDQEHLYKIVDAHIFSKAESSLPLLHDIYQYYHDELPDFRWSEQRFVSLYPLHPATLEVAPLIRLYLHDFALLGFAAEAGVKILGRPANSLIGIDEVFDSVESRLRNVKELSEAFNAFDQLDREIVGKAPVTIRLFAKLLLKGLFMSSLDGSGTSAGALAAAMLVVDEGGAGLNIAGLLESFAAHLPQAIVRTERDGADPKFAFKLRFTEDLKAVLDESNIAITQADLGRMLLKLASEKFADMVGAEDGTSSQTSVEWRGSRREGEIFWDVAGAGGNSARVDADWSVHARFGSVSSTPGEITARPSVDWILAELTPEETNTLRRLFILQTDPCLRAQFKERAAAEIQIHALSAEKVWKRVFITDATLLVDNTQHKFGEGASQAHTLAQLFREFLTGVFDVRFPSHPTFARTLTEADAQALIAQFFGNSASRSSEAQELAATFAAPLGLAVPEGDAYVAASRELISELPLVKAAYAELALREEEVVALGDISKRLSAVPFGLSKEAVRLVLSAQVAARELVFVTSSGNRINHRSLDLQILWDDIAGICKATAEVYDADRLIEWARVMTGNKQIRSLDRAEDRTAMADTLSGWLANWREARFLEAFDSLSDENLNSNIWRTASTLRRTFEAVAEAIEELVNGKMGHEGCLHKIADLFYDSIEDYERKKKDLLVLRYFIEAADKRGEIIRYLSITETTEDAEVEALRRQLLLRTGPTFFAADPALKADLDNLWQSFKQRYIAHYLERHDAVMKSTSAAEGLKTVTSSEKWGVFQILSDVAWFDRVLANEARAIVRRVRHLNCSFDAAAILATRPSCSCSFRLDRFERRKDAATRLDFVIDHALDSFVAKLNEHRAELRSLLIGDPGPELSIALETSFTTAGLTKLSAYETVLLKNSVDLLRDAKPDPRNARTSARELLSIDPNEWENEIDNLDIFSETTP